MSFLHVFLYIAIYAIIIHTSPRMLIETATSLDNVNLSPPLLGKNAARNRVNKLEVDVNTVTIPASVLANDI